jgi:hypothetical protein
MSGYCEYFKHDCGGWTTECPALTAMDTACRYYRLQPSRQVPVEPPLQISMSVNQYNESLRNAKLFTIQKCREAVLTAMADWSNVWCVADAAISAVEREIK